MQTPLSGPIAISSDDDSEKPGAKRAEIGDHAATDVLHCLCHLILAASSAIRHSALACIAASYIELTSSVVFLISSGVEGMFVASSRFIFPIRVFLVLPHRLIAGPSRGAAAAAADANRHGKKPSSSQPATDSRPAAAAAAIAVAAAVGGAHRSEVQLILPDKLVRHKVRRPTDFN